MHSVAPFNTFGYKLGSDYSWATYERCSDIVFHCEKSSFLAYRYNFSTRTAFSLLRHEGVSGICVTQTHQERNFRNVDIRVNAHLG